MNLAECTAVNVISVYEAQFITLAKRREQIHFREREAGGGKETKRRKANTRTCSASIGCEIYNIVYSGLPKFNLNFALTSL
jgi:hypothetical protein